MNLHGNSHMLFLPETMGGTHEKSSKLEAGCKLNIRGLPMNEEMKIVA